MKAEVIKCDILYLPNKTVLGDCVLTIENCEYWLIINGKYPIIRKECKKWNDSAYKLADDFEIISATDEGREVNIDIEKSVILNIKTELNKICLKLDTVTYGFINSSNCTKSFYLSTLSRALKRKMTGETFSLNYNACYFTFKYNPEYETMCVETQISEADTDIESALKDLLLLISLYIRVPLEIWIEVDNDGCNIRKSYRRLKYKVLLESNVCKSIDYLSINGDCDISLIDFTNILQVPTDDNLRSTVIRRGIERYVVAETLDDISKFVYLVSIIHTFSEKIHNIKGDASSQVKKLLDRFHVDFEKMNKGIEFQSLRKSPKQTFVEVRNEIMHALPSPEIEKLIEENDLVSKVDFAALICILNELGVSNIAFIDGFDSLSILK